MLIAGRANPRWHCNIARRALPGNALEDDAERSINAIGTKYDGKMLT